MNKETKRPLRRIPLRITDTTLRDAHQSLWATRMKTDDMLRIADTIDAVGYYSVEVWGGATFDVCLRFLRENPWERLRKLKAKIKKTPLQMLLRGQNILGYKNYPDDLLEHFVALACENGIDIFRVFDALNDTRNLAHAIECVKRYGGHAQGTLCYTISPVHTVDLFVKAAKEQVECGIDSLCIKDMAGFLSPISAEKLVSALVREIDVPIQLHCHATSGMASSAYVEGVRAGAGAIDCAISPMSGFQSQPPLETMLAIFEEMPYHATLDYDAIRKVCKYFVQLKKTRGQNFLSPDNIIDPDILDHHIPGGMISNLRSQLEHQNAGDRLEKVLEEVPRVRKDLGYPPLVTPTSQIVGTQAVMNVLVGKRYEVVSNELRDYVKGYYGQAPGKLNPSVKEKILGKEEAITCRPADLLSPMLPNATQGMDPSLIHSEEDIISYCLFPEPALEFFKWRALPVEDRPTPPVDIEMKQDKASAEKREAAPAAPPAAQQPEPLLPAEEYRALQDLVTRVHDLRLNELTIRRADMVMSIKGPAAPPIGVLSVPLHPTAVAPKVPGADPDKDRKKNGKAPKAADAARQPEPQQQAAKQEAKPAAEQQQAPAAQPAGPTINSPLKGTFYTSVQKGKPPLVKAGDIVDAGASVCVVEAMKLFNEVKAQFRCKILEVLVAHGTVVEKDQPLIRIEKLG